MSISHIDSVLLTWLLQNHHPMQEDRATELLHVRINRELEAARDDLIAEWKRLPDVVSVSHVGILQVVSR